MTIKLLTSIAGNASPADGLDRDFSFSHGQTVEVADALAKKWIASGIAAEVSRASAPAAKAAFTRAKA